MVNDSELFTPFLLKSEAGVHPKFTIKFKVKGNATM